MCDLAKSYEPIKHDSAGSTRPKSTSSTFDSALPVASVPQPASTDCCASEPAIPSNSKFALDSVIRADIFPQNQVKIETTCDPYSVLYPPLRSGSTSVSHASEARKVADTSHAP